VVRGERRGKGRRRLGNWQLPKCYHYIAFEVTSGCKVKRTSFSTSPFLIDLPFQYTMQRFAGTLPLPDQPRESPAKQPSELMLHGDFDILLKSRLPPGCIAGFTADPSHQYRRG